MVRSVVFECASRLNANRHRSIVVAKGGSYWIYQMLFAKKDRSNISAEELSDLRVLAKAYSAITENDVQHLPDEKEFVEIAHEQKIQK